MKKYIPMMYDKVFKKVFGDPNDTDKLAYLLSTIFKMPYEDFKDNIVILESEKRVNKANEKMGKSDIVLKIEFSTFGKINLELNVGFYKEVIVRNVGYITDHFSSSIKVGEKYSDIKPVIQINFNTYDIDKNNKKILDLYTLKNEENHELTNILQIYHINIDKWYKCWYNGNMEGYSEDDKNLIRMLALLNITKTEDFTKCIGETDMEEKTKKNFVNTMDELASDEELMSYYGSEEELEKLRRYGEEIREKELKETLEQGHAQGLAEGHAEGRAEGIVEGQKSKSIEIAKNLLKQNLSIENISLATGLSIDEIKKLTVTIKDNE